MLIGGRLAGKCCNGLIRPLNAAASKEYLGKIQIVFVVRISISLAILSETSIQIGYCF